MPLALLCFFVDNTTSEDTDTVINMDDHLSLGPTLSGPTSDAELTLTITLIMTLTMTIN